MIPNAPIKLRFPSFGIVYFLVCLELFSFVASFIYICHILYDFFCNKVDLPLDIAAKRWWNKKAENHIAKLLF